MSEEHRLTNFTFWHDEDGTEYYWDECACGREFGPWTKMRTLKAEFKEHKEEMHVSRQPQE